MTTRQATKDPLLRGVSPTPSKIPVRSQKRTPFPTVTSCAVDQENQDPRGVRASAYLAPRTPTHRLDPARASCFSRLEGPGPRGRTLCPQRLQALISPSGPSFHPSTRPSFQELRRETAGSSRTSVSQASGLLLETPVQPAFSLPKGEREVVTHSDEGGVASLGLAQRVPLRENREMSHTR
ncbi:trophinin associated protein, partial [Homo sapiens]